MSKFFTKKELDCRCGLDSCTTTVRAEVVERLDRARSRCDFPWIVTSGGRCANYNRNMGSKPTSSHVKGLAMDIIFHNSHEKFMIIVALLAEGFTRIGINDRDEFIHVDADADKPQQVLFKY